MNVELRRSLERPGEETARPRRIVAIEGLDGAGKSTVARAIRTILRSRGRETTITGWNEATDLYNLMMRLNAAGDLTPTIRAMFGAADLAARLQYVIDPALKNGHVVLAVKYLVPRVVHARIRGVSMELIERLYSFVPPPLVTLLIDISPEVALERKRRDNKMGFWESGLDQTLTLPLHEAIRRYQENEISDDELTRSFVDFQTRLLYHTRSELSATSPVIRLDGTLPPEEIARVATESIERLLADPPRS